MQEERPEKHVTVREFEADTALLDEIALRKPFFKGRLIGVQDQPSEGLCLIGEGQVLLSRANDAGEDYALHLLGPGEVFGEGALQPESQWLVTARAITDGFVYVLTPPNLPRVLEYYPALGVHILRLLSERLERAHRRQDVAQSQSARDRLLKLLLLLAEYHGEPEGAEVWVPLHLTQTELGEMVGLARETVARTLSELEEEALIRRGGRKGLWIRASAGKAPGSPADASPLG